MRGGALSFTGRKGALGSFVLVGLSLGGAAFLGSFGCAGAAFWGAFGWGDASFVGAFSVAFLALEGLGFRAGAFSVA